MAMSPRRQTVDPSQGVLHVEWPLFGELSRALALKVSREYDPDMVVGVDISPELEDTRELKKGFDVLVRANAIKAEALKNFQCKLVDVLIRPKVGRVHWADFSGALTLIEEGDRATTLKIPEIQEKLERARWKSRLGFSRGKRFAKAFL